MDRRLMTFADESRKRCCRSELRTLDRLASNIFPLSCRLVGLVFLLLITKFNGSAVRAEDPFDDLRARIENLEEFENQIRTSGHSKLSLAAFGPEELESPREPSLTVPHDSSGTVRVETDEERIDRLIQQQLDRRQLHLPSLDVPNDERTNLLEGKVAGILDRLNRTTFPTAEVHGAFQADTGFYAQDANSVTSYGQLVNGANFRRARIGMNGALNDKVNYFMQFDFGFFGRPSFTDVWVEQTDIPYLGTVRIGQWKQPFSLEVVSSYRYTTFLERSVLYQPFTAFRYPGIGFYDHKEDLSSTWALSIFATGQDYFGNALFQNASGSIKNMGGFGTAERLTWVPYWNEETKGANYLHLGVANYFNAPPGQTFNFRSIPEFYIGANAQGVVGTSGLAAPGGFNGTPSFVQTGPESVDFYNVIGTEVLWVEGPFSLQSEAMVNFVSQSGTTAVLSGAYGQIGYFLTGEHRPFIRKLGMIDRIMPFRNFSFNRDGCSTGIGAWEVAGRLSYINLNDEAIQGGTMTNYTLGVNWYLNPHVKLVLNYIHSSSDYAGVGGNAPEAGAPSRQNQTDMFGARCQMDF